MNAGETKSLKEAISNLKVASQLCGEIGGDLMQQLDESITIVGTFNDMKELEKFFEKSKSYLYKVKAASK